MTTENPAPTVMVVDDHPIWRDAVARDLADEGFDVVATADGVASAKRRAAVVQPAVVVMDMRLADGDGAQATAEVLSVSQSSRILVLSAHEESPADVAAVQQFVDQALILHNRGELSVADAARAKLFATETAGRVIDRCLQLHGGYGYITEYPIARLYADTRVSRIYGGTNEVMKTIIAKDLGL